MPSGTDRFEEIPPHERPWLWRSAWPAWFVAKRIAKSLLGIAGLISAILVILAAGTYLRATWTNFEDYDTLRPLAAGMSEGRLAQALGEPSTIRELTIDRGGYDSVVSLRRYIEDHFVVSAFVDESGEVILMSVLSCDTGFHPRFTTPGFTTDPLNSGTLAQIHSTHAESVDVNYIRETTGGGPVVYTETVSADASRATRNHAWAWGTNAVCDPRNILTDPSGAPLESYTGSVGGAPDQILDFRRSVPPNFYVETSDGLVLDDLTLLLASPSREDVPAWFLEEQGVGGCGGETPGC
jgi:hypothetical protein